MYRQTTEILGNYGTYNGGEKRVSNNVFIFNLIAQQIITSSRRRISIYSRIISDSSNNRLEIDADTYYTINNNKNELW